MHLVEPGLYLARTAEVVPAATFGRLLGVVGVVEELELLLPGGLRDLGFGLCAGLGKEVLGAFGRRKETSLCRPSLRRAEGALRGWRPGPGPFYGPHRTRARSP